MPDPHFPRLADLPPYALGVVEDRKAAMRAAGELVYDFGLGNPDRYSPPAAVSRLIDAIASGENHRYQPSPGLPFLRQAICDWYARRFGVTLDPATEAVATIGSKEGLAHLLLAIIAPGDVVLVPDPCYPIHRYGVWFAGGIVHPVPVAPGRDAVADLEAAYLSAPKKPRFAIVNFPHNPTTATATADTLARIVRFAVERDLWLISDLAYADLALDGNPTPSMLAQPDARGVAVEFFTTSKSFNMPGWRCGFCVGNPVLIAALKRMKTYLDYGIFAPIQHGAAIALQSGDAFSAGMRDLYRERAQVLVEGLNAAGWPVEMPRATMFVWAKIPASFSTKSSVDFTLQLLEEARVSVAPGIAFGDGGEGHVRFALIEEVGRIREACARVATFLAAKR